jgi:hypothetical protein
MLHGQHYYRKILRLLSRNVKKNRQKNPCAKSGFVIRARPLGFSKPSFRALVAFAFAPIRSTPASLHAAMSRRIPAPAAAFVLD